MNKLTKEERDNIRIFAVREFSDYKNLKGLVILRNNIIDWNKLVNLINTVEYPDICIVKECPKDFYYINITAAEYESVDDIRKFLNSDNEDTINVRVLFKWSNEEEMVEMNIDELYDIINYYIDPDNKKEL